MQRIVVLTCLGLFVFLMACGGETDSAEAEGEATETTAAADSESMATETTATADAEPESEPAMTTMMDAETTAKVEAAKAATEPWLALIDEGNLSESYAEAAQAIKNAVTAEQWEQQISATMTPLGKLNARELMSATYSSSMPGAPDGDYVTIQYQSSFENKAEATETVIPQLEEDGQWRVAGYFIN